MKRSARLFNVTGRDLTEYLMRLLMERDYCFITSAEREIVRDIKETCCYVAYDYKMELAKAWQSAKLKRQYTLPDGNVVSPGREAFRCPEALFDPSVLGRDCLGLHQCLVVSFSVICYTNT